MAGRESVGGDCGRRLCKECLCGFGRNGVARWGGRGERGGCEAKRSVGFDETQEGKTALPTSHPESHRSPTHKNTLAMPAKDKDAARAKLRREKVALGGQISVRVLDYSEIPVVRRIFAQGMLGTIGNRAFSWLRGPLGKTLAYCASGGGLASFFATVFIAGDGVLDPVAEKWFWRRLAASLFLCGGSMAWIFFATIAPGLLARSYVREQLSKDMYDPFTQ